LSKSVKSIVILHGTNYWNMGDLGLMLAAVQSLRSEFPQHQITILSQFANLKRPCGQEFAIEELGIEELPWLCIPVAKIPTCLRGPWLMTKGLMYLCLILATRLLGRRLLSLIPFRSRKPLQRLFGADVIVSKPGGFVYGYDRVPGPHHLQHLLLASMCGPPVVIYGQSIGPFSAKTWTGVLAFVLRRMTMFFLRDQASMNCCMNALKLDPGKLVLTADEAFRFHAKSEAVAYPSHGSPAGLKVGLTVINWAFPESDSPEQTKQSYLQALEELIIDLRAKYDAEITMFSFLRARPGVAGDDEVSQSFYDRVGQLGRIELVLPTDPFAIKAHICKFDIFIGSRMHSNIFALGEGVPVLAIAYQPKTTSIMEMLGLSEFVSDIYSVSGPQLIALADRLISDRFNVAANVRIAVDRIATRAAGNASGTAAVARKYSTQSKDHNHIERST